MRWNQTESGNNLTNKSKKIRRLEYNLHYIMFWHCACANLFKCNLINKPKTINAHMRKSIYQFSFYLGFFKWFGNLIYVLMVFSCQFIGNNGQTKADAQAMESLKLQSINKWTGTFCQLYCLLCVIFSVVCVLCIVPEFQPISNHYESDAHPIWGT